MLQYLYALTLKHHVLSLLFCRLTTFSCQGAQSFLYGVLLLLTKAAPQLETEASSSAENCTETELNR